MRLEKAALIAEIIGGFAVLMSVIYLAIQLSDNNRLLRSQAHFNALELSQRSYELLLESDTLAGELEQCKTDPHEVDNVTWSRCSHYYFMQANAWEYIYYQNLDDSIPPELWIGGNGYFSNEAQTNAGWFRFWSETALAFGEPFRSYFERHISQNPSHSAVSND